MNRIETLDAARQAITVDRAATQSPIESEMQDMDILAIAGGRKDDQGKARFDLIPPEFLSATAGVLTFGAAKYGERNWEAGMDWGRPFAALQRHMWAWWGGEDCDPETGRSHLAHASCCLAFLTAYEVRGSGNDDRPGSTDPVPTEWTDAAINAMVDAPVTRAAQPVGGQFQREVDASCGIVYRSLARASGEADV